MDTPTEAPVVMGTEAAAGAAFFAMATAAAAGTVAIYFGRGQQWGDVVADGNVLSSASSGPDTGIGRSVV